MQRELEPAGQAEKPASELISELANFLSLVC